MASLEDEIGDSVPEVDGGNRWRSGRLTGSMSMVDFRQEEFGSVVG
jgi:hypothetical protein